MPPCLSRVLVVFALVSLLSLQIWQVFAQDAVLVDHAMCLDVDRQTELPLNKTTKFFSSDRQAVSWFEVQVREIGPISFVWIWFDPKGTIYKNTTRIETIAKPGPRRFWDILTIRGQIENMTGNWNTVVYFRARSVFNETFTINPSTYTVTVTVKELSQASKVGVFVDNRKQVELAIGSVHRFTFQVDTPHNVSVDYVVRAGDFTRFVCTSSWRMVSSKADLVFEFEAQYYLRVRSEYGKIEPGVEGWYRNGTRVMFRVDTPIIGTFGVRYDFAFWSGDSSGTSPSALVVMNRPRTIVAVWKADYEMLYAFIGLIAVVLCGAGYFYLRRKNPGPEVSKSF